MILDARLCLNLVIYKRKSSEIYSHVAKSIPKELCSITAAIPMVGRARIGKRDLNGKLIVGGGLALKGGKYLSKYLPLAHNLTGLNIC